MNLSNPNISERTAEQMMQAMTVPEELFLLGSDEHYAVVAWLVTEEISFTTGGQTGDEALLAFCTEAMAIKAIAESGEVFADLKPIVASFDGAREVAKHEDLDGIAIVRSQLDISFHYVR